LIELSATDADGDALTFGTDAAFGELVDNVFILTPTFDDSGVYTVEFSVSDGELSDSELVEITVVNVNRAPELVSIGSQFIDEGSELLIELSATDADGDTFTYATDAAFGDLVGNVFSWTPTYDDSGVYTVEFSVSDGKGGFDSKSVEITVDDSSPANRAPELDPIGAQSVDEGSELVITLSATDADGDALAFSTNATFGELVDNIFSWTPGSNDAGVYYVEFGVSDGNGVFDSELVEITVEDVSVPTPLTIESVSLYPANTTPGATMEIIVDVVGGADGIEVAVDGVSLSEIDGVWKGSITAPAVLGEHTVLITATDNTGSLASSSVLCNVRSLLGSADVSISPRSSSVAAGDIVTLEVRVKNNENIDEIFNLDLDMNVDGVPPSYCAESSWFGWQEKEVRLRAGEEIIIPLEVEIPGDVSSYRFFCIKFSSAVSPVYGFDTGYFIVS